MSTNTTVLEAFCGHRAWVAHGAHSNGGAQVYTLYSESRATADIPYMNLTRRLTVDTLFLECAAAPRSWIVL